MYLYTLYIVCYLYVRIIMCIKLYNMYVFTVQGCTNVLRHSTIAITTWLDTHSKARLSCDKNFTAYILYIYQGHISTVLLLYSTWGH